MLKVVILEENDFQNLFSFLDRVPINPSGNQGIAETQVFIQILSKLKNAQSLSDFEKQIINDYEDRKKDKENKEKK